MDENDPKLATAGKAGSPDLDSVDQVERIYLQQALIRARELESRSRGLYAEALLQSLLDESRFGPHAMSPWDLKWDGHKIAIRATGDVNSYTATGERSKDPGWSFSPSGEWDELGKTYTAFDPETGRRVGADVLALCFHEGDTLATGWSAYVLNADEVNVKIPEGKKATTKRFSVAQLNKRGDANVVRLDGPDAGDRLGQAIADSRRPPS